MKKIFIILLTLAAAMLWCMAETQALLVHFNTQMPIYSSPEGNDCIEVLYQSDNCNADSFYNNIYVLADSGNRFYIRYNPHLESEFCNSDSCFRAGWIEKKLVGFNPFPGRLMKLYTSPAEDSVLMEIPTDSVEGHIALLQADEGDFKYVRLRYAGADYKVWITRYCDDVYGCYGR